MLPVKLKDSIGGGGSQIINSYGGKSLHNFDRGYQVTESDCGAVALLSAFNFLFQRSEIPPDLVEAIYKYTADHEAAGTSRVAMSIPEHWLNLYAQSHHFPVRLKRLVGQEVIVTEIDRVWKKQIVFRLCVRSAFFLQSSSNSKTFF